MSDVPHMKAMSLIAGLFAALELAAMPLGLRTAAWSGEDDAMAFDDGAVLDDITLTGGTTLNLVGIGISARSITLDGTPTIIIDALPQDGLLVPLAEGAFQEGPLNLIVGGTALAGYAAVVEPDGLYALPTDVVAVGGRTFATLAGAFKAAEGAGEVALLRDYAARFRIDIPPGAALALDLGGNTLSFASRWAFNVGDGGLVVSNGALTCSQYGFYVLDGVLVFADGADVRAAGRVVQVHGAGAVDICENARLETALDDPVVFAVGGFGGRARVSSRGTLVQNYAGSGPNTAYAIAGNPDDTYGADFALSGRGGVYFARSPDASIHHPDGQGGVVAISGGWFSLAPALEWLSPRLSLQSETLDGWDGWRVVFDGFFLFVR